MIHARQPTAFGYGLVKRIACRGDAEAFAVTGAETADRFLVHQRLNSGEQIEMVNAVYAALVGGVEAADAFDFVAEEIEPQPNFAARREQVDDTSANRELARFGNGIDSKIAV